MGLLSSVPVLLALAALSLCTANAQTQVTIFGRAVDETGAGVAGARVQAAPERGAVPVAAVSTDLAGNFKFSLPAGEYEIRAEREGFYVFTSHSQRLDASHGQLVITLNHEQEFPEQVEVKDSPPAVDPQQPADRRELTNTEIQAVPYAAPQDYRNALQLFNGVVPDNGGRFHFNGAATNQTSYLLDGFNVSNPVTGQLDARVNIDTVQNMQVLSSRFSADNGRGSAGVLDLATRVGDDHWRFMGTNFIPTPTTAGGIHIDKFTPRLELSGPIKKGRAWFNSGFDVFYSDDVVNGLPSGQNQRRSLTADDLTRIRIDLTPSNILTTSLLWNLIDNVHNGLTFLNPIQTTTDSRQTTYMSTVRDQHYFHGGALLDMGFADTRGYLRSLPQGDALYEITPSGNSGNYYVGMDRHYYRQQTVANLFMPTFHLHGSHLLKFGVDFEREAFHQVVYLHDYEVLQADNSVARFVSFVGSPFERQNNFEAAQYVQDHWTPRDNLSVDAGLRAEWNEIMRDLEWAPRISTAWAPKRLGGLKFSAGWGVYYDAISLELVARRPDLMSLSTFFLPDGAMLGPAPAAFMVNDRSLSTPRYQNASMAVERKLPFDFYGRAGFTHRSSRNAFAFEPSTPEYGADLYNGALFELRNTRQDRYDAFDLSLKRTFAGKYEWFLGYTRSKSRTSAAVEYSLENPIFAPQLPGPFPWDTPTRIHMWGWVPLPKTSLPKRLQFIARNTTAAYLVEYRTGFPFSVVNQQDFLVGSPGSMRYPAYFSVNLHFERQFRAAHYLWAWRVGFDNLTNNGNPNYVNNVIGTPLYLTYQRGQARAATMRLRLLGRK